MLILCLFLAFNFLMYDMHIHALFRVKVCNVNRLDRHTFEKKTQTSVRTRGFAVDWLEVRI